MFNKKCHEVRELNFCVEIIISDTVRIFFVEYSYANTQWCISSCKNPIIVFLIIQHSSLVSEKINVNIASGKLDDVNISSIYW